MKLDWISAVTSAMLLLFSVGCEAPDIQVELGKNSSMCGLSITIDVAGLEEGDVLRLLGAPGEYSYVVDFDVEGNELPIEVPPTVFAEGSNEVEVEVNRPGLIGNRVTRVPIEVVREPFLVEQTMEWVGSPRPGYSLTLRTQCNSFGFQLDGIDLVAQDGGPGLTPCPGDESSSTNFSSEYGTLDCLPYDGFEGNGLDPHSWLYTGFIPLGERDDLVFSDFLAAGSAGWQRTLGTVTIRTPSIEVTQPITASSSCQGGGASRGTPVRCLPATLRPFWQDQLATTVEQGFEWAAPYHPNSREPHGMLVIARGGSQDAGAELPMTIPENQPIERVELMAVLGPVERSVMETCYYDGPSIERVRLEQCAEVRVARTGRLVDRHCVQGESPPRCPATENNVAMVLEGSRPEFADIRAWLEELVGGE
jgi:hypothetical protein